MNGLNLTNKLTIGIDFNVVSNPNTHEVLKNESKYISDGEVITSFTIKNGEIVKIGHRNGVVDNDLEYATENIFKYINPLDLIKIVKSMVDEEYQYINGVKIIRLLNYYVE